MTRHKWVKVFLTEAEKGALKKTAEKEGLDMSAWIRQLVLKRLRLLVVEEGL